MYIISLYNLTVLSVMLSYIIRLHCCHAVLRMPFVIPSLSRNLLGLLPGDASTPLRSALHDSCILHFIHHFLVHHFTFSSSIFSAALLIILTAGVRTLTGFASISSATAAACARSPVS